MSDRYGQVEVPATTSTTTTAPATTALVSPTSAAEQTMSTRPTAPTIATPTSVIIRATSPLCQKVSDTKEPPSVEGTTATKLIRTLSDVVADDDASVVRNFLASESPSHCRSSATSTSNITPLLPDKDYPTSKPSATVEQRHPWCKRICNKASRKNVKEEGNSEQQQQQQQQQQPGVTNTTPSAATISVIKKDDTTQSVCKPGFLGSMLRCHKRKAGNVPKTSPPCQMLQMIEQQVRKFYPQFQIPSGCKRPPNLPADAAAAADVDTKTVESPKKSVLKELLTSDDSDVLGPGSYIFGGKSVLLPPDLGAAIPARSLLVPSPPPPPTLSAQSWSTTASPSPPPPPPPEVNKIANCIESIIKKQFVQEAKEMNVEKQHQPRSQPQCHLKNKIESIIIDELKGGGGGGDDVNNLATTTTTTTTPTGRPNVGQYGQPNVKSISGDASAASTSTPTPTDMSHLRLGALDFKQCQSQFNSNITEEVYLRLIAFEFNHEDILAKFDTDARSALQATYRELNPKEWARIHELQNVLHPLQYSFSTFSKQRQILKANLDACFNDPNTLVDVETQRRTLVESINIATNLFIRLAKQLDSFAQLNTSDQSNLLRNSVLKIMLVRRLFVVYIDKVPDPSVAQSLQQFLQEEERLRPVTALVGNNNAAGGLAAAAAADAGSSQPIALTKEQIEAREYAEKFTEHFQKLGSSMEKAWMDDPTIFYLLFAIILFRNSNSNLTFNEGDKIKEEYLTYVYLLRRYLEHKFKSYCSAKCHFVRLYSRMEEINKFNDEVIQKLMDYDVHLSQSLLEKLYIC